MKFDSRVINDIEYVLPKTQKVPDAIVTLLRDKKKLMNTELLRYILSGRMSKKGYIVEVGCNIGSTALWMADYQSRDNKIIAIDGSEHSITCLKESIRRNNFTNIDAIHAVVSHSNFQCGFYKPPHERSTITRPVSFFKRPFYRQVGRYLTKTLDEIIGDRTCSIIIISVEGHETGVLTGAVDTIERDQPPLIVAYNSDYPQLMGRAIDTLYELSYEAFMFVPFHGNVGSQTLTLQPIIAPCQNCGKGYLLCFPQDHKKHGFTVLGESK